MQLAYIMYQGIFVTLAAVWIIWRVYKVHTSSLQVTGCNTFLVFFFSDIDRGPEDEKSDHVACRNDNNSHFIAQFGSR